MKKLPSKKTASKTFIEKTNVDLNNPKNELYKPLKEFAWKDASRAEIRKNSIAAYEQFTF